LRAAAGQEAQQQRVTRWSTEELGKKDCGRRRGAEAQQNEGLGKKKKAAKVGWNNNRLELLEGQRSL